MPTILLINTSFPRKNSEEYTALCQPMGLLAIATSLVRSGFTVDIIDPQIEDNYLNIIEHKLRALPLFVGMTTFMGTNILNAVEISRHIKEKSPQTPIIWGGPMATSSPGICFKNAPVDYIVMGMGEKTVVEIAETIQRGDDVATLAHVSTSGNLKKIYCFDEDLDGLGYPQLSLWEKGIRQMETIPILSSRGCPRDCAFCYNNTFSGRKKWYGRSAESVLGEMDSWAQHFNIDRFYFIDDNFLVNSERACRILEEVIKKKYQIGQIIGHVDDFRDDLLPLISGYIGQVGFAIESASPRIQKLLNKTIDIEKAIYLLEYLTKKHVGKIATNFMFGFPTETDEDISANIRTAYRVRNINRNIKIIPYIYTPQPGDDIIPKFPEIRDKISFSLESLSSIDMSPNRTNYLSREIRPWMSPGDIQFYLNLTLVFFYHFHQEVRESQQIDVKRIYNDDRRIARLFEGVPML